MPNSYILATVSVRYLVGMSRESIESACTPTDFLNLPIERVPWKAAKHLDSVH